MQINPYYLQFVGPCEKIGRRIRLWCSPRDILCNRRQSDEKITAVAEDMTPKEMISNASIQSTGKHYFRMYNHPCFHEKYMEAGDMTSMGHCIIKAKSVQKFKKIAVL